MSHIGAFDIESSPKLSDDAEHLGLRHVFPVMAHDDDLSTFNAETRLPLVEERISVETEKIVSGRVRVRTHTELSVEEAKASLDTSEVEIVRVPVGLEVVTVPETRVEGDITIVPVLEEVLVVEKRLFLKEEIHIRRSHRTEEVSIPVTVRKQRAVVERQKP